MRKKLLALSIATIALAPCALAQIDPTAYGYYTEALRYSQTQFGGSARFVGVGGANTALGGDITAANSNPAGLGFIRKSELSFSPTLGGLNSNASFLSQNNSSQRANFSFNHIGITISNQKNYESDWRGGTFSISFARVNDFQNNTSYSGINKQNSMIDYFLESADGISWDDLYREINSKQITSLQGLAYDAFLINPYRRDPMGNRYVSFAFDPYNRNLPNIRQSETIKQRGAQNQWTFAYGTNYKDRLYIGASFGLQSFRFEQQKSYNETIQAPSPTPLDNFTLNEKLTQRGTGANLSVGLIFRPINALRLGVNLTTPTLFSIRETYTASIDAVYNGYVFVDTVGGVPQNPELLGPDPIQTQTVPLEDTYALRTPFRASAGAAIFFGKAGFLSADLEYVDYTASRLSNSQAQADFTGDNRTVKTLFRRTYNLRLGGEARLSKYFRLRAVAAYYASPYSQEAKNVQDKIILTGGLGWHKETHYVDFTLMGDSFSRVYTPYRLERGGQPVANIKHTRATAMLSIGIFLNSRDNK